MAVARFIKWWVRSCQFFTWPRLKVKKFSQSRQRALIDVRKMQKVFSWNVFESRTNGRWNCKRLYFFVSAQNVSRIKRIRMHHAVNTTSVYNISNSLNWHRVTSILSLFLHLIVVFYTCICICTVYCIPE